MSEADAEAAIQWALNSLMENFDAVMVLASRRTEDGSTQTIILGEGNYNARWGMVKRWMKDQK